MGAGELPDAPWADWADNRPGWCGDGSNAAIGDDDADADGAPSTNAMISDLELALAREGADARGVDPDYGPVDQPLPRSHRRWAILKKSDFPKRAKRYHGATAKISSSSSGVC